MKNSDIILEIEQQLKDAAARLPEPRRPVPVLPAPESGAKQTNRTKRCLDRTSLLAHPIRRIAGIALILLGIGATTAFASSPALREAVVRLFASGVVEQPPIELLNPTDNSGEQTQKESESADLDESSFRESGGFWQSEKENGTADIDKTEESVEDKVQTAGDLTIVQPVALDEHFSALYASSKNNLDLIQTPSGNWLFSVQGDDGVPVYYAVTDGRLEEITLRKQSLTAAVHPERLPGLMDDAQTSYPISWPDMEFTVFWQRYGSDILLDDVEPGGRFDIGSTFGGVTDDYDGMFGCRAFPGRTDQIQVFLYLDSQRTDYCYPFLLNLDSGEVSDPLLGVDFSAYPCITELEIADDLKTATALAGENQGDLREITVDIATGRITEAVSLKPPVTDCYTWFATGEDTLFYGVGDDSSLDGYLYHTRTQSSTLLFSGAASHVYEEGFSERRYRLIGGGYAVYQEGENSFLVDLHDGTFTQMEGIPSGGEVHYFFNRDFTVLSIEAWEEETNTKRLAFLIPATGEAAWFSRKLPEQVEEYASFWSGPFCYAVRAREENDGRHYLYLYQYTP